MAGEIRQATHRALIPVPSAERVWLLRLVCDSCREAIPMILSKHLESRSCHTRPYDGGESCHICALKHQEEDSAA